MAYTIKLAKEYTGLCAKFNITDDGHSGIVTVGQDLETNDLEISGAYFGTALLSGGLCTFDLAMLSALGSNADNATLTDLDGKDFQGNTIAGSQIQSVLIDATMGGTCSQLTFTDSNAFVSLLPPNGKYFVTSWEYTPIITIGGSDCVNKKIGFTVTYI